MKKKNIADSTIRTHVKRHTGKSGRRKVILIIAALAGGSYAAYRYFKMLKVRRAQELSERLRFGRNKKSQSDNECSSAYFEGYKDGLKAGSIDLSAEERDGAYYEGYEAGRKEGHDSRYAGGYQDGINTGFENGYLKGTLEAEDKYAKIGGNADEDRKK